MIEKIRNKIDVTDKEILKLLNERVKLVIEIGKIKSEKKEDIFVPAREKEIVANLRKLNKGPISNDSLSDIIKEELNIKKLIYKKGKSKAKS